VEGDAPAAYNTGVLPIYQLSRCSQRGDAGHKDSQTWHKEEIMVVVRKRAQVFLL
jgi:hypothetical protein